MTESETPTSSPDPSESLELDKRTVLAIGAHPDCVEKTCAGTLALLRDEGWKVVIASMTPGDKGSETLGGEDIAKIRRQEAKESAGILEADYYCLEWRELAVFFGDMACKRAASLIRRARPSLVLTHPPHDSLPDMEETSRIVRHACSAAAVANYATPAFPEQEVPAPLKRVPHLYYFDPIEGIDILGRGCPPSVVVDVTPVYSTRERMLDKHASQRKLARHLNGIDDYVGQMKSLAKGRGKLADCEFGEGFCQHVGQGFPRNDLLSGELGERVQLIESS